jgi:hypothetical protein
MMKTSISALLAFTSMLGGSNGLKLSVSSTLPVAKDIPAPPGAVTNDGPVYTPASNVLTELENIFDDYDDHKVDARGNKRMTYKKWVEIMSNNKFFPENKGCVELE